MSFTDDENKRIEDAELKAQEEIRAKFQSMFSKEEDSEAARKAGEEEQKDSSAASGSVSSAPEKRRAGSRVVQKVEVEEDLPVVKRTRAQGTERPNSRVRKASPDEPQPAVRRAKPAEEAKAQARRRKPAEEAKPAVRKAKPVEEAKPAVRKAKPAEEAKAQARKSKPLGDTKPTARKTKPAEKAKTPVKKTKPAEEAKTPVKKAKPKTEPKASEKKAKPEEERSKFGFFKSKPKKEPLAESRKAKPAEEKPEVDLRKALPAEPEVKKEEAAPASRVKQVNEKEAVSKPASEDKKVRISGPGYSLSGHKILTDSNYEEEMGGRRPSKPAPRDTDVPETFYVAPGIQWFRQDVIPPAVNELTRGAVINSTGKVRKRERRVLKAAEKKGSRETVKRAQVSVFAPEARMEESIIPADAWAAPGRRAPRLRFGGIDNSRKSQRKRQKYTKTSGPGGKIAVVILLLLAVAICVFGYITARDVFDDAAMNPEDLSKIEYTVYEGTTDDEVAEFLVTHNMVESAQMYRIRAKIFDADYVPGTYELSPSYSTEKIINILSGFDYSSSGS